MIESPRTCLLVEDQAETRTWMRARLGEAFPGLRLGEAGSVREARAWLDKEASPDLALIDLGLPDGSGMELIRLLSAKFPRTLVVVATIYDDDTHLFEALSAGARGYLLKDEAPELISGCLRRIVMGQPPLSPSIAHRILGHFRAGEVKVDENARLSAREGEVLALLARGLTVAEAARSLGLQPQTVAGYVKIIYQKLNISSRAEAALAAARRGLV